MYKELFVGSSLGPRRLPQAFLADSITIHSRLRPAQNSNALHYDLTMATSPGNRNFQLHYNILGPQSHMGSVVDRNVIMRYIIIV